MNATVVHNGLRLCLRCQLVCTETGQPDPRYYSPEWIKKFNASRKPKCKHTRKALPMTTDELLAKLDDEHERLESELPELYQTYGRYAYAYPNDQNVYNCEREEIRNKLARQQQIRDRQRIIKEELA